MAWLYILHSSVTLTLTILGTKELNLSLCSLICPKKDKTREFPCVWNTDTFPLLIQPLNRAVLQPYQKAFPVWFALSIEQQHMDQRRLSSLPSTCFSSATKQKKTTLTIWKGTTTNLEGNDCAPPNPMPRRTSRSNPLSLSVLGLSLLWFKMSLGKLVAQPWFTLKHFHSRALLCLADTFRLLKIISAVFPYFLKQICIHKSGKSIHFDDQESLFPLEKQEELWVCM